MLVSLMACPCRRHRHVGAGGVGVGGVIIGITVLAVSYNSMSVKEISLYMRSIKIFLD